ncbi:MAG: hypothetical protein WD557_10070 [Dehalococcoidia bacterium]
MAFTVYDLRDLLKLLREHPEWREEVRREVLTDELLSLPDLVRQNSEDIRALTRSVAALTASMESLSQRVRVLEVDMAEVKWDGLEVWYRLHAEVLAPVRQLRKVSVPAISSLRLLDEAYDSGTLTADQLDSLYAADLLVSGREGRGDEARDAILVVEISNTIDQSDLDRAVERAGILSSVGYLAYPVVAGRTISDQTGAEAKARGIAVHLRAAQQQRTA